MAGGDSLLDLRAFLNVTVTLQLNVSVLLFYVGEKTKIHLQLIGALYIVGAMRKILGNDILGKWPVNSAAVSQ